MAWQALTHFSTQGNFGSPPAGSQFLSFWPSNRCRVYSCTIVVGLLFSIWHKFFRAQRAPGPRILSQGPQARVAGHDLISFLRASFGIFWLLIFFFINNLDFFESLLYCLCFLIYAKNSSYYSCENSTYLLLHAIYCLIYSEKA